MEKNKCRLSTACNSNILPLVCGAVAYCSHEQKQQKSLMITTSGSTAVTIISEHYLC